MARRTIDREMRKAIVNGRKMIEAVSKADGNEAETRRRVERIFESVMGYDAFKHLSREKAVKGTAGTEEYCDFSIHIDGEDPERPVIFVELKRVNVDLARKHLKQVASYAINAGCEWIILTNGREWRLYHVSFGQPPETKLISSWNLLQDDPPALAEKFALVSYKNVKSGGLKEAWEKANVLTPRNVLTHILSEDSIRLLRRQLKKTTGVAVTPEDIVGAIRRLLNEAALAEMENIKISLPSQKRRRTRRKTTTRAEEGREAKTLNTEAPFGEEPAADQEPPMGQGEDSISQP